MVFYFRCSVYWWDCQILVFKNYYFLNINYSVIVLNECVHIPIDCSQLSKTYYNVLFGSFTRDRHAHDDAYIGRRSENNIKCVVHDDLG